ncbi:MAG: GIY-YIG nuclease family protein [Ignavibacteriaceae bacterium]
MDDKNIGYSEYPPNGEKIIRARTTAQIRSWEFPRSTKALEKFNQEIGKIDYPGIYLLLESKRTKIYVGEAKSLYQRLKTHNISPEDKIKDWDKVIIINDGRPATQSDFNDNVIRKTIEEYLIRLFKSNKYKVVAQGEKQNLNPLQKVITHSLIEELNFFLLKKNLIIKLIADKGQEEVMLDELRQILLKKKFTIDELSAYEGIINKEKVFIRPGSKKNKGWQVTFRDVFKNHLKTENGNLIIPRGDVIYIPFSEVIKVINDPSAFEKNTIDVFFAFIEDKVFLRYKNTELDVTSFLINNS